MEQENRLLVNPTSLYQYFGLYTQHDQKPLPLKRIQVNAKIDEYLAEITYFQTYFNNNETLIETEYFFPISHTICFHKFSAKYAGITVEGVIKEKQEAKQKYEHHKKQGDLVAYAEISDLNYNVLCIKLGNIPPKSEVQIEFAYFERVEISLNKYWRFSLSSCLFPKALKVNNQKLNSLAAYPMENTGNQGFVKYEINITVNSRSPFTFLQSTTHKVDISQSRTDISIAHIKLASSMNVSDLTKDFVLLYATESLYKPSYMLSPFEDGYCALINFFPKIEFEDAFIASLEGKELGDYFVEKAKKEYIFVLDNGSKVSSSLAELQLEALQAFFQMIPNHSYFNILGLDESFFIGKSLGESILASKENKNNVWVNLPKFMTKTAKSSSLETIKRIGNIKTIDGYSRVVFFLTSGNFDVQIGTFLYHLKELFRTRVFMLGFGNAASTDFVKRGAIENSGGYEIILDSEEIENKVKHLLQTAASPYFTEFELKLENEALFSYVVPLPKSFGYITPNELVEFFVIFKKELRNIKEAKFSLRFNEEESPNPTVFSETIRIENEEPSEAVVKLGLKKFIESQNKRKEVFATMKNDIGNAMEQSTVKNLISSSIKHGILTNETAFFCVVKEGDDITRQIPTEIITISDQLVTKEKEEEFEERRLLIIDIKRPLTNKLKEAPPESYHSDEERLKTSVPKLLEFAATESEDDLAELGELSLDLNRANSAFVQKRYEDEEWEEPTEKFIDRGGKHTVTNERFSQQLTSLSSFSSQGKGDGSGSGSKTTRSRAEETKASSSLRATVKKKTFPKDFKRAGTSDGESPFSGWRRDRHLEKQAISISSPNKLFGTKSRQESDKLRKLIELQTYFGYWEPLEEIEKFLNKALIQLFEKIPKPIKEIEGYRRIWLTILLISWLESFFSDLVDAKISIEKAKAWLRGKSVDYSKYSQTAKTLLIQV